MLAVGVAICLTLGHPMPGGAGRDDVDPGVRLVSQQITERGRRPEFTIEITYPRILDPTGATQRNFNLRIAALARSRARDFKRHLPPSTAGVSTAPPSSLDVSYVVGVSSRRLVSVGFEANTFFSGAVHPNHEAFGFTYDLQADRRLELGDLFAAGAAYLGAIARHCADVLPSQVTPPPDRAWIRRGTAPTRENYRHWVVTEEGVKIIFNPLQAAPYLDGIQEVLVPHRALRGFIDSQSPLAELAARTPPR